MTEYFKPYVVAPVLTFCSDNPPSRALTRKNVWLETITDVINWSKFFSENFVQVQEKINTF